MSTIFFIILLICSRRRSSLKVVVAGVFRVSFRHTERERERENERERKEEEVQQKRVCDIKISRGVIFWQMQFLFPLVVTRSKLRNFV